MLRDQIGQMVYPVHRLDRPTSGALVFALSSEMARALAEDFGQGRVEKTYLAVVRGIPAEQGTVDYPLREELDRKSDFMAKAGKPAQAAITHFKTLASHEFQVCVDKFPTARYAMVAARPVTGRKHQIRRHLRHLGHPIIGDVTHGSGKHNRFFESQLQSCRLLLACRRLVFDHPRTKQRLEIESPLAPEFQKLVERLNWSEFLV
jgi:tRNA pseudouridine65 synthase